ncbi:hypothetical protein Vretimale_12969 [Volvox reticuliferus]|nr:hypothetical protein Vretimale_12969 [Volvox reticuliferus]
MSSLRRRIPVLALLFFLIAIIWQPTDILVAAQKPSPSVRSSAMPSINTTSVSLQGKLIFTTSHPNGTWRVDAVDGNIYFLPAQPVNPFSGALVGPGRWVTLTCFVDYRLLTTVICSRIIVRDVLSTSVGRPLSTGIQLRALVMVISLSSSTECGMQTGAKANDVHDAFMSQPDGFADFFNNCSYGKMVFDRDAFTVASVEVPCFTGLSYPSVKTCNYGYTTVSNAAEKLLPPEIIVENYSHTLYVLPSVFSGCGWDGMASLPGTTSWFPPKQSAIFSKNIVMQEILHNFGLYHGWSQNVEYNDLTTAMGKGMSCPSAPELMRLEWASPLAQLNSANLPVNIYSNFILPATYTGSDGVMIRIQPDWMWPNYTVNVYLSLRVKRAGDKDLKLDFDRKLNIHELNKDIDNGFTSLGDPRVTYRRTAGPNEYVLFNYNLHFRTGNLVEGGSAIEVKVCHFTENPRYCRDLNQPLFPPRAPPSPPFPPAPPSMPSPRKPPSPQRPPRNPPSPRKSPRLPPSPPRPPPPSPPPRHPPSSPASSRRPPPIRPPPKPQLPDEFPSSTASHRRSPTLSSPSLQSSPMPLSSPHKHSRPLAGKRKQLPSPPPRAPPRLPKKPASSHRRRSPSVAGSTENR